MTPQWFWFIPLFVALGVAGVTDLRSRRIPNSLTLALACAGLLQSILLPPRAGGSQPYRWHGWGHCSRLHQGLRQRRKRD